MRVCQFRHDGNLNYKAAAAEGRRVRKINSYFNSTSASYLNSTAAPSLFNPSAASFLAQLRGHGNFGVQDFGNRAACFGGFGVFLESGGVCAGHFSYYIEVARCNGPAGIEF